MSRGNQPARVPWRSVGRALAFIALGIALWPWLGDPSDAAYRTVANGVIGRVTFGTGGHAAFQPVAPRVIASTAYDDDASWSTRLELRVDGIPARESVRLNARRLLYLPSVLLAAVVLASPLPRRRKAVALGAGAALLCAAALLSSWLTAVWLFASAPGLVYDLSSAEQAALRFAYEAWVSALGNRYVLPIIVGVALVFGLSPRRTPARPPQPEITARRSSRRQRRASRRARSAPAAS